MVVVIGGVGKFGFLVLVVVCDSGVVVIVGIVLVECECVWLEVVVFVDYVVFVDVCDLVVFS